MIKKLLMRKENQTKGEWSPRIKPQSIKITSIQIIRSYSIALILYSPNQMIICPISLWTITRASFTIEWITRLSIKWLKCTIWIPPTIRKRKAFSKHLVLITLPCVRRETRSYWFPLHSKTSEPVNWGMHIASTMMRTRNNYSRRKIRVTIISWGMCQTHLELERELIIVHMPKRIRIRNPFLQLKIRRYCKLMCKVIRQTCKVPSKMKIKSW